MSTDPPGPAEQPDPTVGNLLAGRYRISALLAQGGMARVYRARDERLERDVAVKVLSPPYADDPAFAERFLSEARAAASLSHPSLVHVYDSGSEGAQHFIVMELLDRHKSLRQVLEERGRLGVAEVVGLGRELLAGLRVVHDRGLVHCDVKSGNVLLGPGPAKLIDFGIARTPEQPSGESTSIGSLPYMSPEQLRGDPLTPASDLFALGVVLYEAISGRLPFSGRTPEEVASAQGAGQIRPPSTLVDGVPGRLDAAILQTLRHEPGARFRNAQAMDAALEASLASHDEEETRVVSRVREPEPGSGYVPPPVPAAPVAAAPARRSARRTLPSRSRGSGWGVVGTTLLLAAVALVIALVVVPLLELGRDTGGPGASANPGTGQSAAPEPGTVKVPNTIGLSKEEAIAAATAAGLNWTIRCAEDATKPEGIIEQEPPPDTPVARGARFTMYSARFADCG